MQVLREKFNQGFHTGRKAANEPIESKRPRDPFHWDLSITRATAGSFSLVFFCSTVVTAESRRLKQREQVLQG